MKGPIYFIRTASGNAYIYCLGSRFIRDLRDGMGGFLITPTTPVFDLPMFILQGDKKYRITSKVTEIRR